LGLVAALTWQTKPPDEGYAMTSCPEYKSFVDRHGNLDSNQKARLDAHLESCGDCTEYKADADRTAHLLRAFRKHAQPTDPIDHAFESLSSRLAASKRQMGLALVLIAICIAAPFAMLLRGDLPPRVWGALAIALAAAAVGAWQIRRGQSAMLRLTKRAGDFYAAWRLDIATRIRLLTGGGVLATVSSVGFLFASILGPSGVVERLVVLSAAILTIYAALHTFIVELPQLKGELRLIPDASDD
jgi:hypothetical protein